MAVAVVLHSVPMWRVESNHYLGAWHLVLPLDYSTTITTHSARTTLDKSPTTYQTLYNNSIRSGDRHFVGQLKYALIIWEVIVIQF